MAKISDINYRSENRVLYVCDFSPPRGPDIEALDSAKYLCADWICVASNPGQSVRATSETVATHIKRLWNKDVIFTIATRDMNKIATQSILVSANINNLQNVLVVKGDNLTRTNSNLIKTVYDFSPTNLISSIQGMNKGQDYKGDTFHPASNLCPGGVVDVARALDEEIKLTQKKISSGAEYIISQPTFNIERVNRFMELYTKQFGIAFPVPFFQGIQLLSKGGTHFGGIPDRVKEELRTGRTPLDIALGVTYKFMEFGIKAFYLIPPIGSQGIRNYDSAQEFLEKAPRSYSSSKYSL